MRERDIPWETWLRRENAARQAEGLNPLGPDDTVTLRKRLEGYDDWHAKEIVERLDWVLTGYINGYLSEGTKWQEVGDFIEEAQARIANMEAIENYRLMQRLFEDADRPLTDSERLRKEEWQRSEAERQVRMEMRKQRMALKQGRETLTLIRQRLRAPASSQQPESRLAKTSPR